jgi:two-component system, LytTR family, sensor kinase
MKKSKSYFPYFFAFFFPCFSALSHNLLFKPGIVSFWILSFFIVLGLWFLVEWLLSLSENRLIRLGSVLLGSILYVSTILCLDFYVLHILMPFTGFKIFESGVRIFNTAVFATIVMERIKWTKAREKSKIENLTLQSENIEAKYKLLREQVNPEFLFQCLTTLQTMVRADDPQTEGFILKLADVYRQTLKKEKNVVSLREELDLLKSYMFLMRYGREKSVFFDIEVSEAALDLQMPIFALQLLGDNCIKHNIFSESQPLQIRLYQRDPNSITMTNNYQRNEIPKDFVLEIAHLKMRYALEGIENGVFIEKEATSYATTLKLF